MRRSVLVAVVAALAVGGPAAAQTQRYEVTVKPAVAAGGFEKLKVEKAALGDAQIRIWANTAINPDCTAMPGLTLNVLRAPEHGAVTVSDEPFYAAFPPANPRASCNRQKVPGHQAFYQARAGYAGRDKVVLQASTPEGRVREITVDILVR